jgi:C4-dicarboxylate-specific signal transduction histidine kinase
MLANPTTVFWPLHADRTSRPLWMAGILATVAVIASVDFFTGYEFSLFIAYLLPVFLATWVVGKRAGVATAAVAVTLWIIAFAAIHPLPNSLLFAWQAGLQMGVYLIFVVILDRLKAAIARADERFAAVLEGLDALVFVIDPADERLLYVNQRCRQAFDGAPRNAGVIERRFGMRLADLPCSSADGGAIPTEIQDADTKKWYLLAAQTIKWMDGQPVRLHIATDITPRKRAEESLRQQVENLETSQRLITAGEMTSLLAHELNQPLAAIANYNTGCVNRLRSGNWQPRELLEAIEKSVFQARRAGNIIQRVRDFLRKREPDLAPCDLATVIAEVSAMTSADTRRSHVNLRLSLERGLPPAMADDIMIKQVVLNLIRNGIESMQGTPEASRDLQVRLSADSREELHVEVADRGCGLPAELAADPVKPFFTTKSYGMGMGLQICRSIIAMHGGRLWATPNAGGGTVFHFTLAVARA